MTKASDKEKGSFLFNATLLHFGGSLRQLVGKEADSEGWVHAFRSLSPLHCAQNPDHEMVCPATTLIPIHEGESLHINQCNQDDLPQACPGQF